jgi:hypothetical protein
MLVSWKPTQLGALCLPDVAISLNRVAIRLPRRQTGHETRRGDSVLDMLLLQVRRGESPFS